MRGDAMHELQVHKVKHYLGASVGADAPVSRLAQRCPYNQWQGWPRPPAMLCTRS
jgi:hypothetical protein